MSETQAKVRLVVSQEGTDKAAKGWKDTADAIKKAGAAAVAAGRATKASVAEQVAAARTGHQAMKTTIDGIAYSHKEAERLMRQHAREEAKWAAEQKKRQAEMQGMAGRGGPAGRSGGMGGIGLMGFLGPGMAAAAAVISTARSAGEISQIHQNPYFSESMKTEKTIGAVPLVGGLFKGAREVTDNLGTVTSEVARYGRAFADATQQATIRMTEAARVGSLMVQAAGPRSVAAANAANPYAAMPLFDQSTAQGKRLQREADTRQPAVDSQTQAQRASQVARDQVSAARQVVSAAEHEYRAAEIRAEAARKELETFDKFEAKHRSGIFGAPRDKIERARLVGGLVHHSEMAKRAYENREQAIAGERSALEARARAESGVRQAGVAVSQADLASHQARQGMMESSAARLGGMNRGQRMQGLAAFKLLQRVGIERATPGMIALAEGFAPQSVAAMKEAFGESTAEFRAGQAMGIDEFGRGTLKQMRETGVKMKSDIRLNIQVDTEEMAKELSGIIRAELGRMVKEVNAKIKMEKRATEAGRTQAAEHQ